MSITCYDFRDLPLKLTTPNRTYIEPEVVLMLFLAANHYINNVRDNVINHSLICRSQLYNKYSNSIKLSKQNCGITEMRARNLQFTSRCTELLSHNDY